MKRHSFKSVAASSNQVIAQSYATIVNYFLVMGPNAELTNFNSRMMVAACGNEIWAIELITKARQHAAQTIAKRERAAKRRNAKRDAKPAARVLNIFGAPPQRNVFGFARTVATIAKSIALPVKTDQFMLPIMENVMDCELIETLTKLWNDARDEFKNENALQARIDFMQNLIDDCDDSEDDENWLNDELAVIIDELNARR